MKHWNLIVALSLVVALAAGCGGDEEEVPEDILPEESVMSVPDSTIEREVRTRLDADPRLDGEGIELRATSQDGTVMMSGEVPSRMEMSIAREVAMSSPGVVTVNLDSLIVLSEQGNAPVAADTAAVE